MVKTQQRKIERRTDMDCEWIVGEQEVIPSKLAGNLSIGAQGAGHPNLILIG
jgi:hypothetical protein